MDADNERFVAKTTVLIESVSHHIDEDEHDSFTEGARRVGAQTTPGDVRTHGAAARERADQGLRRAFMLSGKVTTASATSLRRWLRERA
jgi:hypothetical protein